MTGPRRFSCLVAFWTALAVAGAAQTGDAGQAATGAYEYDYDVLLGGRIVSVDGSEDKFRTERNLRSGFDAGRIYFDARPVDPAGAKFDHLTLNGIGFGGSNPYQRADLRMTKRKLYDLKAGYRKYYNFFRLPEFARGWHDEDSFGRNYNVSLDLFPQRTATIIAGYRRNQLLGTRFTSQDLWFDAFPVSYPRRLSSDEVYGGVKVRAKTASIRLIQSYIRTRDDQDLLPNGANSVGLRGNLLAEGVRSVPSRISTPVTRVTGSWRPSARYDLNARYMYSGADLDLTRSENLLNRLGEGLLPLRQIISSSGVSEKPTHNFGVSQSFDIIPRLTFHHRLVYDKYTLTGLLDTTGMLSAIDDALGGSLDIPITESGGTETRYELLRNEAELEFALNQSLALVGGHVYSNRHLAHGPVGTDPRAVVTVRNAGLGGVLFRSGVKARVRAEVEKGLATEAFNRIDPLDTLRWKVKSHFRPVENLSIAANVLIEDNKNSRAGVDHDLDNRQVGAQAVYALPDKVLLSGGYNYLRLRTTTDIVYYALSEMVNGFSLYETNTHALNALAEAPLGDRVRVRAGYEYFNDTGATFPQRMHVPRAGVSIGIARGVSFECDWRYYSYDERDFLLRDYNAHVLGLGVRFRSGEGKP